ncbi:hypothetical protein [uncultured Roseibium sp.]|uniref:hypothetical protein n=1 Tax=uncultured Roseibium sp. TaxID=1936171 RepID=UPI0025971A8D|nr:hypothetical protein [uncultured Roseibium sp.]
MTWLAIASQIVAVVRLLLSQAEGRRAEAARQNQKSAGRQEALLEALKDVQKFLDDAALARERALRDLSHDPDSLHADDGFKRSAPDPDTQT